MGKKKATVEDGYVPGSPDWTDLTRADRDRIVDQVMKGIRWNRMTMMYNSVTVNCGCNGKPVVPPIKPTLMKTWAVATVQALLASKDGWVGNHHSGIVVEKYVDEDLGRCVQFAFVPEETVAIVSDHEVDVPCPRGGDIDPNGSGGHGA